MATAYTQTPNNLLFEDQVVRKAFRRLVFYIFFLYLVCFLDRVNIGFAALSMNRELKLTATMFGIAAGIFNLGYVLCEIPSNILLTRFGARKWLARIMVTWGLASTATMFAVGPTSLYTMRLILGVAEAGFVPGVVLYLTFWFPASYRARATAIFMMGQPVAIAIGSSISGLLMDHTHGLFGMAGWRWLFLIEGAPSILLGVITFFYLSDGPAQAKWLTDSEKEALQRKLSREQSSPPAHHKVWREIFSRNVILLILIYFCVIVGLNANATWTPQIVREIMKAHSLSYVGLFTALPALCTVIAMPLWGARSDRNMERIWHFAIPMVCAAIAWGLVALAKMPEIRMFALFFCSIGIFAGQGIFWTVPSHILSPLGRPVGIAVVSSCGVVAAVVSPVLIGFLKDLTHSWAAGLLFVAVLLVGGAAMMFLVPANERGQDAPSGKRA